MKKARHCDEPFKNKEAHHSGGDLLLLLLLKLNFIILIIC